MPIEKFNFVSPGVQVAEIDRSGIPKTNENIGPVVIGRALSGPGMVPVRLESTQDLYATFGPPHPGGESGDVWRKGNRAAPTYGLYAAEAYLKNSGPVTYVKLMGNEEAGLADGASGKAGWDAQKAVGLFAATAVSGTGVAVCDQITASLAAVIYTMDASTSINPLSVSRNAAGSATNGVLTPNDASDSRDLTFSIGIDNYNGAGSALTATFDFNPNSDLYIRKVLNTNPQLTNTTIYGSSNNLTYWLGETYESSVAESVCASRSGAPTQVPASQFAFIFKDELSGNSIGHDVKESTAIVAKSGWIFCQDTSQDTASYAPESMQTLFRFAAKDFRGDWDNKHVKLSIANIKAAVNPTVYGYGTFDVFVREADDTDNSMKILESYTNCNLDPASSNYVARKIGDQYVSWNADDKYYDTYGEFQNMSKFVRIEVADEVRNSAINATLLPAGFYGPPRYLTQTATATDTSASISVQTALAAMSISGSTGVTDTGYTGQTLGTTFGVSLSFPKLVLRQSGSDGVATPKKAFYGVHPQGVFGRRDNGYVDYNRFLSSQLANDYTATSGETGYSFIFTLDDISGSTSAPVYVSGSRGVANDSLRGTGSFTTTLLDNGINNFTLPLFAAFDGFDITQPEPFANRLLTDKTDTTSYEYFTLRKAVDIIRDPDVVEHNVCSIPGISVTGITDYLVNMAEERRDTLALIDIENDYKPRYELTLAQAGTNPVTLPNVNSAVTAMRTRGFNSSYGAAYYPAVQISDPGTGIRLYVPATVAAMAAYGYTDNIAAPWFAPAGFSRGGISAQSSGITATGVSKQLRAIDRDNLYEVNVNPIAQFPAEGIVIYGQKTLQATPSALDRVNVRRLLIYVKKEISRIANTMLFEPNVQATWRRFTARVNPFLSNVKGQLGLEDYRLILDNTTTTPELVDRNVMYARILLKPAKSIEFIALDFEIFRSGASFDD